MRRLAAFALVVCAGCAGGRGTLLEDTWWADLTRRFSSDPPYAPTQQVTSAGGYSLGPPAAPGCAAGPTAPPDRRD